MLVARKAFAVAARLAGDLGGGKQRTVGKVKTAGEKRSDGARFHEMSLFG